MGRLQDKVAIITGGASGIGKSISELYAQQGASVVMADTNPEVEKVAQEISARGKGEAVAVVGDIALSENIQSVFDKTRQTFGNLDILVNNAGRELSKCLIDTEEEEWDEIIRVNLKSVYLMSRTAVKCFIEQGDGGVIVNMGSITAKVGFSNYPGYTATKGAIHALSRQMAWELSPHKIRVNTIFPGVIRTPLAIRDLMKDGGDLDEIMAKCASAHPLGRIGEPEDVAYMAIYLASEESSFVTGQEFGVDGGFMIRGS
jgi:3(or 17)beta-hydroxysteroid dehydrogenase